MTNPDPSRRRCWGWRRRLDRGGKDRLVLGVAVESVFQCDAEIVEARRLRLIRIARADAVVFGFQRDAESVGQLFLQTEPQAERIALGRVVELWPRDDEFVLRVDVLGHERLDERPSPTTPCACAFADARQPNTESAANVFFICRRIPSDTP